MASNKYNKTENQRSHSSPNLTVNDDANNIFVFENGTVFGSLMKANNSNNNNNNNNNNKVNIMERTTPEMVINANKESNRHNNSIIHTQSNHCNNNNKNITISLHHNNNNNNNNNNNSNNNREISNIDSLELELAVESTALLGNITTTTTTTTTNVVDCILKADQQTSESQEDYKLYEQDSDFLESSIYSELHFPPSSDNNTPDIGGVGGSMNDGFTSLQTMTTNRSVKRTKRKHRSKSKCNATAAALIRAQRDSTVCHPPRYTAIYVASTLDHQYDPTLQQIVNVAAHSPLLANQPVAANTATYLHRPMYTALTASPTRARHQQQRSSCYRSSVSGNILTESTNFHAPPLPLSTSSSTPINWNLRKWCTQPSLPFIIGLLALGGVACTLVGIVLGSTGLIGHSTQYLSAALLLIGIGVSLLVIAGAIWRLSLPDVNECRCYQRMEMCRTCSSPFCENRILTTGYIYPEFQHRAPPPSYMTSLYGCTTNGINFVLQSTGIGVNTPPPVYQSTNSLRITSSSNPDMDHNNLVNSENTNTLLNVLDTNQNENVITINSEITPADVTHLSEVKKDVQDLDLNQPSID